MLVQEPRSLKGPSPTLATVHRIEKVLRQAARRGEGPLSYAEIERRLPVKKIRRETLKAALRELARFHLVAQASKGVMWVQATSDAVWDRPRKPLA
ncbi:MAG: hypothetical protein ACT4PT_09640 [Methanobacteriota archaeon]